VDQTVAGVHLSLLVDEGLGNTCYLLDAGDGRALVVDPPRDLRAVSTAAGRRGLAIAWAADTHLHADFLSGARQLNADQDAEILAAAAGDRAFAHTGLRDGAAVDLGGLALEVIATPGHTEEHLAYLLRDGNRPVGVFTGGSLLVGSAARTDLVDPGRAEELARAQYASIRRLLELPDEVAVWPTHGAGSFCSAPPGAERTTTIGAEKAGNPLLAGGADEDTFVARLLGGLGTYPSYFDRLGEVNRRGPLILDGPPALRPLTVAGARRHLAQGAAMVDVRPVAAFSAGHIPGAISIPLREQFVTWLGWLLDPDTRIVIVRNPGQDPAEIAWQAAKIGYDRLTELDGGLPAWTAAGGDTETIPLVTPSQVDRPVLDIRQRTEHAEGHLPGAFHLELGSLATAPEDVPDEPLVVMCGHGERAMTAASLLARAGHRDLAVLDGGPTDWAAATGKHLETGA
jgi:glyoxylase-like metal-dependent hydrolase (beta-lactamase superfamily II)/rhodanese-related sulfurtransferase